MSAGALQLDMERQVEAVGFINPEIFSEIRRTWKHEMDHKDAFGGPGEFSASMEVGFSSGHIVVGWMASFTPHIDDEVDPLRMVRTAMAPGVSEMSQQDKRVADYWWDVYLKQLQEKELETSKQDLENDDVTSDSLINVDNKEETNAEGEKTTPKTEVIGIFIKEIDKMVKQGRFPDRFEVLSSSREDILVKYENELKEAFNKACIVVGIDPFDQLSNKDDDKVGSASENYKNLGDFEDIHQGEGIIYKSKMTEGIIN
jgi:hypothetical protein